MSSFFLRFSSTSTQMRTAPTSSAIPRCTTPPSAETPPSCSSSWTQGRDQTRQTSRHEYIRHNSRFLSLSQVTCSICPCYLLFGFAFWIFQPLWQPPVFCIIVTSTSELLYSRLSSPRLSTCEKRRSLPSFHAFHMFNILSSFNSTDL